jgi:hypothetical protein
MQGEKIGEEWRRRRHDEERRWRELSGAVVALRTNMLCL